MTFYRRRLPHWQPQEVEFFITWRLYGSLPRFYSRVVCPSAGEAFVAVDRDMDKAVSGSLWLKDPQIADCVSEILLAGASRWRLYDLCAWVVMANHIHILIRPLVPLRKALMNVKSASAREANAILGRTGEPFWQDESYDHWVRGDRDRSRSIRYIEKNPVSAGPVESPGDWRWSSAGWQRTALPHTRG